MRKVVIIITLALIPLLAIAGNDKDLEAQLKDASNLEKINIYVKLVNFYAEKNNDSAYIFLNKAINLAKKIHNDTVLYDLYNFAANISENLDKANKYFDSAFSVVKKLNNDSLLGEALQSRAYWLENVGLYPEAINYYSQSLKYFKDPGKKAEIYNSLGMCYKKIGAYDQAIKYYQTTLKLLDSVQADPMQKAFTLNNIAKLHYFQKNYETALEYYYKILDLAEEIEPLPRQLDIKARTYLSISQTLNALKRYAEALENVEKAKRIFQQLHSRYIAYAYKTAAQIYGNTGKYEKAIEQLDSCIMLSENNLSLLSSAYKQKAEAYLGIAQKTGDPQAYQKAISYAFKALEYIKQTKTINLENKTYQILYKSYAALGDYKNAFKYALEYIRTNEILFNDEKTKVIQEMEAKYQAEKKQQEIEKQRLIIEKQTSEMKRQKMQRNALIAIVVLITAMAFVTYRSYRQKKRDNQIIQQKNRELEQAYEEIRVQRDQLQEQKNKIERMHEQLQDSIRYAKRIQTAAMPSDEQLANIFDDYFVFFRPLNIVSGDFYWAKKIRDRYIAFTVADCTGHGVPGAFVSMLGISLLNEIVQRREITKASDVLEEMRKEIKISLKQSTNFEDSKDGMDIAFCVYDTETHVLQFAGANNPLYLIRNGELIEYKAVKNPVAIYIREKPFETHYIQIQPGDTVYLSSDGYYDQPGGPEGKKFMRKRFKEMLVKIWNMPMKEQREIIERTFDEWKNGYKQIDDVCVMGVRFEF